MTASRLRRVLFGLVDAVAWLAPAGERDRFRAQWHADLWHRCDALDRAGLINARTARALAGRASGAARHALHLRLHHGGRDMIWHDLRHGLRTLGARPGFAAVAILTLALGIGANAVIFSWIEATLLNPMPGVRDARSLTAVHFTTASRDDLSLSYPNYLDLRDAAVPGVAGVAAFSTGALGLRTADGAERVWGQVVSGNLFDVIGVQAARGRVLTPDDDRTPGGHPVVVVSHAFWQRRLGGRDDIVGSPLTLNTQAFTVIGVTPEGFHGTQPLLALDVFLPMAMQATLGPGDRLGQRGSGFLQGLVRLAPGASMADAQTGLDVLAARLAAAYPDINAGRGLRLYRLWRQPSGGSSMLLPVMTVLGGLVALLLAVVCANMGSLLLARANGRQRELAVRRSLGATRGQIVRLLTAETVLLAMGGGLLASAVAQWSGALLRAFMPPMPIPVVIDAGLKPAVLIFATAVSVVAGLLLGVVPGLHASRVDVLTPLKDGSGGNSGAWRRGWLRQGLIVGQVATALVLLVSAGLFVRTLDAARRLDPGFAARDGVVGALDMAAAGYDEARALATFRRLVTALGAVPGVEAAAVGQRLPLTMTDSSDRSVDVAGYTPRPGEEMTVYYASVGEGYFDALRLPLVTGRDITARDTRDAPDVAVVNETMARRYWPDGQAIGGKVKAGDRWLEVVGIVADAKYASLSEAPRAFMYLPVDQWYRAGMRLVVRTTGPPDAHLAAIRGAVRQVDPGLPLFDIQTLAEHRAFSFFVFELAATLLGAFGVIAALLAGLGLYGVIAHSVAQRTREIGVRMSLGATAGEIRGLVVKQGATLAALGVVVGLALAVPITRLFAPQLLGVGPLDPVSYAATGLALAALAAAACYVPARRASQLDPVAALRKE
jgi:predicted permease